MPAASDTTAELTVPAMRSPVVVRDNPLTRSPAGLVGLGFLALMLLLCLGSLPWTLTPADDSGVPRYNAGSPSSGRLPPAWMPSNERSIGRAMAAIDADAALAAQIEAIASDAGLSVPDALAVRTGPVYDQLRTLWPRPLLGTDHLGRSLWMRVLTGGGISLVIGIAAALISVAIGTIYGAIAGYAGGKLDAVMMRIVDVLYGLPYILLVVLLAVASDAMLDEFVSRSKGRAVFIEQEVRQVLAGDGVDRPTRLEIRSFMTQHPDQVEPMGEAAYRALPPRELSEPVRRLLDVLTLLVAIAAVSWLTMARVVRGQVLSLKNQPFVEAARAMGAPSRRIFVRHLLPNLIGPIVVYATLAVPQAVLQESFLSFLGIGVKPPLPSWGNLAAEGLAELNTFASHWWLLFFPCLLLGLTLLALNFVGEGLREAFDPKRSRR